jgi:hypothetical protein
VCVFLSDFFQNQDSWTVSSNITVTYPDLAVMLEANKSYNYTVSQTVFNHTVSQALLNHTVSQTVFNHTVSQTLSNYMVNQTLLNYTVLQSV